MPVMPQVHALGANKTGLPGLLLSYASLRGLWMPQHSATWADLSPYGNTGTATDVTYSGTAPFARMPIVPGVFNLNGKVECGSGANLDDMAAISFVFWGTIASVGGAGAGRMISKEGATFSGPFWHTYNANLVGGQTEAMVFYVAHATTPLRVTTKVKTYNYNVPVMLAATWTGGTATSSVKMYSSISGSLAEMTTGATNDTAAVGARASDAANSLVIGNRSASDRGYQGTMSLIAVFNAVLTAADIEAMYLVGVNGP